MKKKIAKSKGHAENLLEAYIWLRAKFAVAEPLFIDSSSSPKLAAIYHLPALNIMRHMLYCDCALDVVKLSSDNDRRTPSISNMIKALLIPEVCSCFRCAYAQRRPAIDCSDQNAREIAENLKRRQEKRLLAEYDRTWENLQRQWDEFCSRPWLRSFEMLRNKYIAHLELRPREEEYEIIDFAKMGLKIEDLREALDDMKGMILNLNRLIRIASYPMDEKIKQLNRIAREIWK